MAKATKKAKAGKAAAPKKAAKAGKAAAPKKAAVKKSAKAAAPKKVAAKKSAKAAAPKKAAVKKSAKAAASKKAAVKKVAAKKVAVKKAAKASRGGKKVAVKKSAKAARPKAVRSSGPSPDQRPMLEALFIDHLKDIYWAEKHLTKALPKMRRAATSPELQQAFEEHLGVTNGQIDRLERVFEIMGKKAQGKKCDAMAGLVMEADSVISDTEKGSKTRDVGLIIAAQKVEHYEIASYGGLATLAKTLGIEEAKNLLGETLDEEKEADERLTELAENNINVEAEQEGGSEDTSDDENEDEDEDEESNDEEDEDIDENAPETPGVVM